MMIFTRDQSDRNRAPSLVAALYRGVAGAFWLDFALGFVAAILVGLIGDVLLSIWRR